MVSNKQIVSEYDKTNCMIYHSGFKKTSLTYFSLKINGTKLKGIESYTFLGIWFDGNIFCTYKIK